MRFFAVIAVCLFAVLSEVGGQSNHALTQTAKTPSTDEMSAPFVTLVGNVGDEVGCLHRPSRGIRFEDHLLFSKQWFRGP